MFFLIFISLVIVQRVVELGIARKNENWMKSKGGIEVGENHYKYIVLVHAFFFMSLIFEVTVFQKTISSIWYFFLVLFLIAQVVRVWSLLSLGRFWNTKIIILPTANLISTGPYQYLRHPNYVVVIIEILVIPLIFNAVWTALIFSLLNLVVLSVRIPIEEKALKKMVPGTGPQIGP